MAHAILVSAGGAGFASGLGVWDPLPRDGSADPSGLLLVPAPGGLGSSGCLERSSSTFSWRLPPSSESQSQSMAVLLLLCCTHLGCCACYQCCAADREGAVRILGAADVSDAVLHAARVLHASRVLYICVSGAVLHAARVLACVGCSAACILGALCVSWILCCTC